MKKKKVLFMVNNLQFSDGVAKALLEMCNNMDHSKFDIDVVALYRYDPNFVSLFDKSINCKKFLGFYFNGLSFLMRKIPLNALYRHIVKKQYDIEVAFQYGLSTRIISNSLNSSAVHVAWMHGYDKGLTLKDCYMKLDRLICVSKYNVEQCKLEADVPLNVSYCYNLLDDKKICEQSLMPVDMRKGEVINFVTVGRLSPEKGYIRLVKIFAELKQEGYTFKLYIVGGGAEEDKLRQAIKQSNLEKEIILTGAQNNPHKYTANADIFICSSFAEGYSTACAEAAVLGTPIITTSVPGGEEIIHDCECGILTGLSDEELKDGIRTVLNNKCLITEWKGVLKRTSSKFGMSYRRKNMRDLFDEFYEMSEKRIKNKRI